ncbi:unnamed protein product [Aphanomyces euteiches]
MDCNQVASARWSAQLDNDFLRIYACAAAKPHYAASGGKSLKAAGWQWVLRTMNEEGVSGNVRDTEQLKNRWRRLKEDYSDFHWLCTQHSGGGRVGMSDEQWTELDKRGKKHKMSRFRHEDFAHYEAMQAIVGDTLATGEFICGSNDLQVNSSVVNVSPSSQVVTDVIDNEAMMPNTNAAPLSAAQRRVQMINEAMKKNRKRKIVDDQVKLEIKRQNAASLSDLAKSVTLMAQVFASKYNVQSANSSDTDDD